MITLPVPAPLQVLVAAMVPIGELRLSIPLGVYGLGLPWPQALLLSLVGNMAPVLVVLPLLDRVARLLQLRPNPLGRLLEWRVQRLQAVHAERFLKWGAAALVLFVAVPLPFTGAWTGTLAAWAFRVPYKLAVLFIGVGVLIAGAIVTAATLVGGQVAAFLLAYR